MLAVRLDDGLLFEVDGLAKAQHTSRSGIVRQAIVRFLEDFEDNQLAEISKKKSTSVKSLKEIRKELELDSEV